MREQTLGWIWNNQNFVDTLVLEEIVKFLKVGILVKVLNLESVWFGN